MYRQRPRLWSVMGWAVLIGVLIACFIIIATHHEPTKKTAISKHVPSTHSSSSGAPLITGSAKSKPVIAQPASHVSVPPALWKNVRAAVQAYFGFSVRQTASGKQITYGYAHMPSFTVNPEQIPPLPGMTPQGVKSIKAMCLKLRGDAADVVAARVKDQPQQLLVSGNAQTSLYYGTANCQMADGSEPDGTPFIPSDGEDPVSKTPFNSLWQLSGSTWKLLQFKSGT